MMIYHASAMTVAQPQIRFSRPNLDFGRGFYLTMLREQAVRYAERFKRQGLDAFLNCYDFDMDGARLSGAKVKTFQHYDNEWIDYVLACRSGQTQGLYDIVEGGIADDRIFETIDLFQQRLITQDTALERLSFAQPNHQICILNQQVINRFLVFREAVAL